MESLTRIAKGNITYALFLRGNLDAPGVKFFTEQADEFQMGLMRREKGYAVHPHTHPRATRPIEGLSEFLWIRQGKVEVTVFDEEWNELAKEVLSSGDCLLFFRGGHALTMLEETSMLEVKQGPYEGDEKTKRFRP